ncbi:MAG: murein biosynthesis integral membrane protein MurJ [Candidatus Omnitrophica bacterium]|nr:murein biosynthesis integral membrane protein MurJ [Candidatus Omnitrophota bacterium]
MTTNKTLIKSTGIISSAITSSRILGFLRDILFARWFGTNIYAQAFVVAYRIPNMLRDMVGEGATNAAIVPVLSNYRHTRSEEEYWTAARVIFNLMLTALSVVTVLGVVFAPLLVRIIAPGFLEDPEKFRIAVFLTRVIFPYIFFLGLLAYSKGVLNSLNYFLTPAFAPVVLNISIILSLLFLSPLIGIKGVVIGIIVGGLFQVLMQLPPLYRRGFRLDKSFQLSHPVGSQIGRLLLPRAMGTAVYQVSILIDTVLASLAWIVGAGGVAALYYSNRLVQLPLAVFGISLATAALPRMSREVAMNDIEKLRGTVSFSLRTVFTIMVPAAVGLMVLAKPIVRILFERGEFTPYSTSITVNALFFYTFGLLAYAGIKILVGTYYSLGDTRTPVKTALAALLVNIVFNLILMWPLKIGGLALATSIAATTNLVILYVILMRRIGDIGTGAIISSLMRIFSATVVMGLFTFFMKRLFLDAQALSTPVAFLRLLGVILTSGIVYFAASCAAGVEASRKMLKAVIARIS